MGPAVKRHASYLFRVFEEYDDLIEHCVAALKDKDFDTLVGTGLSGTLILLPVAKRLGVHAAVVRKQTEKCHSGYKVEGAIGTKWILLDDQVDSGATVRRAIKAIEEHLLGVRERAASFTYLDSEKEHETTHTAQFVGVFAYLGGEFGLRSWFPGYHFSDLNLPRKQLEIYEFPSIEDAQAYNEVMCEAVDAASKRPLKEFVVTQPSIPIKVNLPARYKAELTELEKRYGPDGPCYVAPPSTPSSLYQLAADIILDRDPEFLHD